jgi:polyribonucleotide nucleotidyltransferase
MGTPPKLAKSRRIEEIPPRTTLTLEHRKPQNRAPLLTDLGGESKENEPRRVHAYIPYQIPKRKVSKSLQENSQERAPKITKKNEREQHIQALRNHAESSIHHKEVHTWSTLPLDHPSLSQGLTMKLSS